MTSHPPSPYTGDREQSVRAGKAARENVPLKQHATFTPARNRDPIGLLEQQARTRIPELVPVRYGRMLASPFSFLRGAALPMAADLATTATTSLTVQLCGDAHLANFGGFGSPERHLVFDVNDFDETLPGPFEWDVKRLAASLNVAGRVNGFTPDQAGHAANAAVTEYREAMRRFATMSTLDVWYSHLDVADAVAQLDKTTRKLARKSLANVRDSDGRHELDKLTKTVNGQREIISEPPLIVPIEDLAEELDVAA
ncbi:MAG TPA: DUF2252 family protein, partial [Streptosporangiaceae bacterium]|nr:DUF2252 family protein [Streptosporangiaceae bacterium]